MARSNYNFAKRQRELAKKARKEEKQQRKSTEGTVAEPASVAADTTVADGSAASSETADSAR